MGWLTRLRGDRDVQDAGIVYEQAKVPARATTFSGVSDDPRKGVHPLKGLYEFWTASDKHVWLHDMDLCGFAYAASPSPELRITFNWGDDPVPDSYAGPVVEFIFGNVRIYECSTQEVDGVRGCDHPGDVEVFDYNNGGFSLSTTMLDLSFWAETCRVETHD